MSWNSSERKRATNAQVFFALCAGLLILALGAVLGTSRPHRPAAPVPPFPPVAPRMAQAGPGLPRPGRPVELPLNLPAPSPPRLLELPSPEESVVLNEVHYHPESGDPRDEWIEIHNRSTREVDLGGWKLAEAVEFTFPAGASIKPGEHLVVCADPARAREALGIEKAAGGWTGDLSDTGETIRLVSASGKEAESFAYEDGGRFPVLPDGMGRSLERRDPHRKAGYAGNWGAAAGEGWQRVQATGQVFSQRLYLYLLGEGVAYLDDLVVRRGPAGGEVVLREDFEGAAAPFRMNGNHARSEVSAETSRSGKRCLKVVAEGAGSSSQNSVLLEGLRLAAGDTGTLEFWAYLPPPRTPLLARFSVGRQARSQPAAAAGLSIQVAGGGGGYTPGRQNSIHASRLPPFIFPLAHAPETPRPAGEVTVTATVSTLDAELKEVLLHYDTGRGERSVPLLPGDAAPQGGGPEGAGAPRERVYSVKLAPFEKGTLVRYRVTAEDRSGGKSRFPFAENPTRALGFYIEHPPEEPALPVYRVFIAQGELSELEANPHSDLYRPADFVHAGRVYCDVGVRYRGQTSRYLPKRHWKVRFNKDQPFLTPAPGLYRVRSINLNSSYADKTYLREMLSYDLWRDLGEPYHETWHARMYVNEGYYGLYLHLEVPNEDFLARNGRPGTWLWKSYSEAHDGLGAFELEAGEPGAGEAALKELVEGMNRLSGEPLERFIRERMDVDSFIDFLAACQLIHSADHVQKNYLVHLDPERRFTFLPWDTDLTHGRNYELRGFIWNDTIRHDHWDPETRDSRLLFGTRAHPKCDGHWNGIIDGFLSRTAAFRPLYYRRLAELLARHYHPEVLVPRVERLHRQIRAEAIRDRERWPVYGRDQGYDRDVQDLIRWIGRRHEHLQAKLLALGHPVGEPLNAHFEAPAASGLASLTVSFRNLSVGQIETYHWDFGDGEESREKEPAHVYRKPGRYDVTLKVTGRAGAHAAVRRQCINVLPPPAPSPGREPAVF